MTLYELIQDIHALDRELQKFEEKYSLLSEDFYELYMSGALRDENLSEIDDYGSWAAFYRMRQRRKRQYDDLKKSRLHALGTSAQEGLVLTPYAVPAEA